MSVYMCLFLLHFFNFFINFWNEWLSEEPIYKHIVNLKYLRMFN
jgi:hypothetical protein